MMIPLYHALHEKAKEKNMVFRLRKCLYGLKQSGREWYKCINDFLMELGFKSCKSDAYIIEIKKENGLS